MLKFGGTSVSTPANWHNIARVLRDRVAQGLRPLVVHSALDNLLKGAAGNLGANALFALCRDAEQRQADDAAHKRGHLDAMRAELERIRGFIGKLGG